MSNLQPHAELWETHWQSKTWVQYLLLLLGFQALKCCLCASTGRGKGRYKIQRGRGRLAKGNMTAVQYWDLSSKIRNSEPMKKCKALIFLCTQILKAPSSFQLSTNSKFCWLHNLRRHLKIICITEQWHPRHTSLCRAGNCHVKFSLLALQFKWRDQHYELGKQWKWKQTL